MCVFINTQIILLTRFSLKKNQVVYNKNFSKMAQTNIPILKRFYFIVIELLFANTLFFRGVLTFQGSFNEAKVKFF